MHLPLRPAFYLSHRLLRVPPIHYIYNYAFIVVVVVVWHRGNASRSQELYYNIMIYSIARLELNLNGVGGGEKYLEIVIYTRKYRARNQSE